MRFAAAVVAAVGVAIAVSHALEHAAGSSDQHGAAACAAAVARRTEGGATRRTVATRLVAYDRESELDSALALARLPPAVARRG